MAEPPHQAAAAAIVQTSARVTDRTVIGIFMTSQLVDGNLLCMDPCAILAEM
jgi:ribulose 1,5-bisphosphate synthetase/thiazole synthase